MKSVIAYLVILLTLLLPISVHAFPGKVVGITDGDTVKVLRSDTHIQVKIRLAGIDTPEKKQAFGQKAKKFTASLIANRMVEVKPITKDRYGRTVGYIYCDGRDVNLAIVKNGYAWVYRKYKPKPKSKADVYFEAENQARGYRLGLWADDHPVPPWEWRKAKRNRRKKDTSKAIVGKYHGNTNSKVFHRPGCKYYDCKHCIKGFRSREMAIKAGYRPCGLCKP